MEGNILPQTPEVKNGVLEKTQKAEQSVKATFDTELAKVLERLAENPYFENFGNRI
ncbi:MAG: hypothetical protein UT00_C0014G0013 [Parcubacteria group bacterium GW2011_GWA1_38_7]|nr:MAG: hypothetical protein UT00_C0014G0013 [Parcubacteria group bacterium GW2011_GWA1_38_7]